MSLWRRHPPRESLQPAGNRSAEQPPPDDVASPCTSVCSLGAGGICPGCFRSIAEIAGWVGFTDDEKRSVLSTVAARRAAGRDAG